MTTLSIETDLVNLDNFLALNKPIDSPRSLEACLRQGLDVAELYETPIEAFIKEGKPKHVAKLIHEHNEMRRAEKIKAARGERKMIIEYLEHLKINALSSGGSPSLTNGKPTGFKSSKGLQQLASSTKSGSNTPSSKTMVEDSQGKTMMEQEKKRLELMKKRQAKEIEQMMKFEMKMAKIAEDNAKKEALEQQRKEENLLLREKRRMETIERKRKDELRRLAKEEAENRRRRELVAKAFAEEQKIAAMAKAKEKEIIRMARIREKQRLDKQTAQKKATEAKLKSIELKAIAKIQEMEAAEKVRTRRREAKQQAHAAALAAKREKAEKRIADALYQQSLILDSKRDAYLKKQAEVALRKQEREARDRDISIEKLKLQKKEEVKRKKIFEDAKKLEARRIKGILDDEDRKSKGMERVQADRDASMEMKATMKELKKKDKMENIARYARIQEFKRLQTLQKIATDNSRTNLIKNQKKTLILQRKKNQIQAMKRKYDIKFAMEKVRITKRWDDITDIVNTDGSSKKKNRRRKNKSSSVTSDSEEEDSEESTMYHNSSSAPNLNSSFAP